MTAGAAALLAELEARDVRLALAGGALTYDAPPGALTDLDREAVATNRSALVAILAARSAPQPGGPSDRESLTFDPEAPLVARLFDQVHLAWLRSARAGSAPRAGLAWLEAQAQGLAPDLGEDDLAVLAARVLARLCALSPAPGRDLAQKAWGLLGEDAGRQERPLPALSLYRDQEGRPMESWLVALPGIVALNLKALRPPVVPVPVPGAPWGRADLPAGHLPNYLVDRIAEDCPEGLVPPDEALLAERARLAEERHPARPDLFTKLDAAELSVLVPAPVPPPGLPEDCPACRSRTPQWKAREGGRRFLCGRCWKGLDWPEGDR